MHRTFPVQPPAPYHVEVDADGQRIVIPIRMSWRTVAWAAGVALFSIGFHTLQNADKSGFFAWLMEAVAALGLLTVAAGALTSLFAREFVQIGHGRLIHGWRLFGLKRQSAYSVRDIAALTTLDPPTDDKKKNLVSPLSDFGKIGLIKFEIGSKTIHLGPTLNEAEAVAVVEWLARRLPRGASGF